MSFDHGRRRILAAGAALAAGVLFPKETDVMETDVLTAGFPRTLLADGPHPDLGAHADTYGRLIGSWGGEYEDRLPDGKVERGPMEVHFAWALDGRAVQDVWIAPARPARRAGGPSGHRDTFGSTLRTFDPASEVWRVVWLNPARGIRNDLIGRRVGDDIVHVGWYRDTAIKWAFTEMTPASFVWHAYELEADGLTWRVVTEFNLRRTR